MPTTNATSKRHVRTCLREAVKERADEAPSTVFSSVSDAGVRDFWNNSGAPSDSITCVSSAEMSTLRRSETDLSSSTFQRRESASTESACSERGMSCVYSVNKSST
eukprot:6205574-Pleurochrysis_carterae.AAC.3